MFDIGVVEPFGQVARDIALVAASGGAGRSVYYRETNGADAYPVISLASAYALDGELGGAADELAQARRLTADNRYSSITRVRTAGY